MTTRWHKKLVSYSFITVLSIILLFNVFITLWIMTAIGLNSSGLPRNGLSLRQVYLVKFVCMYVMPPKIIRITRAEKNSAKYSVVVGKR